MTAALRIDTDGTITELPDREYETIKAAVGGWIEGAPTDDSVTIWVNEEGKILGLDHNPLGQAFWATVDCYGCIEAGDYMVGPCVIVGPADEDGEDTDVPETVRPTLARLAAAL